MRTPADDTVSAMAIYDTDIAALDGTPDVLSDLKGKVTLVVNVASKCGLTPQYEQLEAIHEQFADRGFSVLGVPCNQFLEQEPGSAEEIATFCSTTYGVTFPMTEKIEVNGDGRHPLYEQLTPTADAEGRDGDIQWNFEKFLVDGDGAVIARFGPTVVPDDPAVVGAIESALG
jgi:glutathione peroxidase